MKKVCYGGFVCLLFILIISNPLIAVSGASKGLLLWFHTIIPTLLPFIILSNLMVSLDVFHYLTFFFAPITKPILAISKNSNYAIILGMICGYPMGAKTCADLVINKKINPKEGQYLLLFTNNVSPMFVISYISNSILKNQALNGDFFIAIYLSPILISLIYNKHYRKSIKTLRFTHTQTNYNTNMIDFRLIDKAIMDGFETITKLGGYIILFSIISSFIQEKIEINLLVKCFILGFVEITTGIDYIGSMSFPIFLKGLIICGITSFGGLSSLAQTNSMIKEAGLSIKPYFFSKLLTGVFGALIFFLLHNFF